MKKEEIQENLEEKQLDENFLRNIVITLSSKPEDIKISRKIDELGVLLTLNMSKEDLPRIIGKEGQTVKAIRSLLRVLGYIQKTRINLKIEIPEEDKITKEK